MSQPIEIYGYLPAWDIPDISPYVTKVCNYMTFAGIPYEYKNQDLTKLDEQTPHGKLPIIKDGNVTIADSNTIIEYLAKKKKGKDLDSGMSKEERATALAFNRMIEEHLYWSGVIEPRWRQDRGFETYIPYIVPGVEITPDLRAFLDAFRQRIVDSFNGQGMGRRKTDVVLEFYKRDVDALADFLGDKKYFMGDKVRSIDASFYSIANHLINQPQKWEGSGYMEGKKNIVDYVARMKAEYKI